MRRLQIAMLGIIGIIGIIGITLSAGLAGSPFARADTTDAATGLSASVDGSDLHLAWSPSPRELTAQGVEWHLHSSSSSAGDSDVDTTDTTATIDLGNKQFLGGRAYDFAVVSLFRDGNGPDRRVISDPIVVTTPERAPNLNPAAPTCHVDQKHLRLTVKIPKAVTSARGEVFSVLSRTLEVLADDHPFITRALSGGDAARLTFQLRYWSTSTPRMDGVGYTVRYRLNTPAGHSFDSFECHTGLASPQPARPAIDSHFAGGRIVTTWAKARSPRSPITKYEIRWAVGSKEHIRFAKGDASRTLSLSIGNATRVFVGVYETNALGGRTYNDVLWIKSGGRWTSNITYRTS